MYLRSTVRHRLDQGESMALYLTTFRHSSKLCPYSDEQI